MAETIVLGLSFLATLYVWWRLFRFREYLVLKIPLAFVAIVPVIGPLVALWIIGMPERTHPKLRATMNHYGIGGRFIGFGSNRFKPDEVSSEDGDDWNPSVPERERLAKKNRGR